MQRPRSLQSYILVFIQFAIITYFLVTTDVSVYSPFLLVSLSGIIIGLWAIAVMNFDVNIFPDVREQQKLIITGPYEFVRHPMYFSVLLFTLGLALVGATPLRITVWVILLINLHIKLKYEETLLNKQFKDYNSLTKHTKQLIPWVW